MRTNTRSRRNTNSGKTTRRSASEISLENGIKIVRQAIRKGISLSAAANAEGKGKNYISDIKARLEENYKNRNISRELYSSFKSLNKQYEKSAR